MTKEIRFVKGGWKEFKFDNGWSVINLSINVDDFNLLPSEKWYVRLTVCQKKEVDQYGNSHYIKLNDYQSEWKQNTEVKKQEDDAKNDLPF